MTPAESASVPLSEIARVVGGRLVAGDDVAITGVSSLEEAVEGDLAYVDGPRALAAALASRASAFVVARPLPELSRPQIVADDVRYAFVRAVERFFLRRRQLEGIAREVATGTDVEIGPDVAMGPFVTIGDRTRVGARARLHAGVFVGDDVQIGEDSILYPNVTVREGTVIGRRVIIHSGSVVGSDGFGYVPHEGRHHKIPQLGHVVIEDDVELGANVTVDRATFGRTVIRQGTKVDNLVQIAHNVAVGPHAILVAQVGIAGSTRLGSHVVVGGQAGFADHLDIGDRAMVAAQAGVAADVGEGEIVSGSPAQPHATSLRIHQLIRRLPELRQELRDLSDRVAALETRATASRRRRQT
jgi:UDP-3-O-[3-hydroxymyristoyl] glucosamine N-acyltransferase